MWIKRAAARVRPHGTICTIVDGAVLADVIGTLSNVCGDINIIPLFSKKSSAERILVSGRIGTRGISMLHRGMDMNCDFVLRDGLTIDVASSKLGRK